MADGAWSRVDTSYHLYDRHGNITSITTNGTASGIAVDSRTNRLSATGTTYDSAGNLKQQTQGGITQSYTWDALDALQIFDTPQVTKGYLYTPSGERLVEIDWSEGWVETWSLRDLQGQVIRQWRNTVDDGESWTWQKDYIRRNGQLVASVTPDEERHYHLDHLGTPRLITSHQGLEQDRHTYFPYGQEATDPTQNNERMKFTGHERDLHGPSPADDLDYMHSRYCSPNQGRFLSVDRVLGKPGNPQSWNRYLYAQGNPVKFVDPDGNESRAAIQLDQDIQAVLQGEMSRDEFRDRNQARFNGAVLGVSLLLPGPEDLALGYAATTRFGSAVLGKAGGFLRRLFRRGGKGGRGATAVARASRESLLKEKKILEQALTEDRVQLTNGRNQAALLQNLGKQVNPHGLGKEINETLPKSIAAKETRIREIVESLAQFD